MAETKFTKEEIDFAMEMIRDLIPYDTPHYEQRLREMAIGCLEAENDPNLISLCEEHDRMLANGELDDYYNIKSVPDGLDNDLDYLKVENG